MTPLDVLAERESIYRLLAQTTPDNLNKDWKSYTLDPSTRYPNLNKTVVTPHQTVCLYDTDNPDSIERMKRASLEAAARQEHVPKKRRRGIVDKESLLNWLREQLCNHEDITITDIASVFRDGKTLCAIIHHYRPDLLDYGAIKDSEPAESNQLAMDILEKDLGIPPFMTGEEITNTEDNFAMATYLTQVYDTFRGEIPHIKHPKLRVKSPSKIPKIIPKDLPKSQTNPLKADFLTKLNIIEQKFSQNTTLVPNSPKSKFSHIRKNLETRGGDDAATKESNKCHLIKISKNEGIAIEESRQKKVSSDDLEMIKKDTKFKKSIKTIKRKPTESRPVKTLSERTFLSSSVSSLKKIKRKKNSIDPNRLEVLDFTYVEDTTTKKKIRSPTPSLENSVAEKNQGNGNMNGVKKIKRKSYRK